ncbi:syndecan isoform X1 [Zerene cesonia]|uniref:syndecan isoform X1 n=1 Tax=Zerene cesonia TaxID=33412 RepID=UPI0018E4E98E|nr:syndecan isoform X1 [Zerene cesonia]
MQLRIYVWLTCVALAGYVRATEDGAAGVQPTEGAIHIQHDGPLASDKDLFIDDDGSGLEIDESSGSGSGPGPGVDDEDGRGSGDVPDVPEDDEDYARLRTTTTEAPKPDTDDYPDAPFFAESEPPIPPPVVQPIDVVSPRILSGPSEGDFEPRGAGEDQPSRPDSVQINISGETVDQSQAGSNLEPETRPADSGVLIMDTAHEDRATSFFAQPGILAAVIGGAVVGLLCAILVVMFIVYRMRKKDEGSYALDEPKRSPAAASYGKGHNNREFYA